MGMLSGLVTILAAVLPFVVGVILLRRGFRGERIDDHPLCRACGFDLFGAPAGSTRCAECGADLTRPRAFRDGHRRRQPTIIAAGLIALAFAAIVAGAAGSVRSSGYDVNRIKPTAWLAAEARWNRGATATSALNELSRRLAARELSDDQIVSLAGHALAHQRDFATPWNPAWGALFEQAHAARKVPRDMWGRYASVAVESACTLEVRRDVRRGDPIPVRVRYAEPRLATPGWSDITWISTRFSIDGTTLREHEERAADAGEVFAGGADGPAFALAPTSKATRNLAPGPHELGYEMTFHYRLLNGAGMQNTVVLARPWTLVSADARTVRLVRDPTLRPAMEQGMVLEEMTKSSARDARVLVTIAGRQRPVPVAYDVVFRAHGREWSLGSVHFNTGERLGTKIEGQIDNRSVTSGDIILRPSESAARRSVDITEIWDGEITIRNVKIVSSSP
jgi:hypothetical protein